MIELSVVVLCYHSGRTILPFFHQLEMLLENLQIEYEIILVANDFESSKDETIEIVKELSTNRPRVKSITKIKEGMMGWDMLQGMNACNGEYICVIDGDGQFPIESIRSVYFIIKDQKLDLVKTYRDKRHDGLYRLLISKIYNFTFNVLYPGMNSRDVNSKPKIFTKEVYHKMNLQSTDWFIDAEIMIIARELKLKIKEIPIEFYENETRRSFVKFVAITEFIWNLIKFKFRKY
jgi:glycosyltransferase involved in cell wall biosynthesis